MPTLRKGSSGAAVTQLQEKLKELGFDPGSTDGQFGPATEAQVIAFQQDRGLDADGVAGPNTLAALGVEGDQVEAGAPASGASVEVVSKMFPATPAANIRANLPFIVAALEEAGLSDKPMLLMALGTIRAETESFQPIDEGKSKFNTSPGGPPFDKYDNRGDLGNQGPPDGAQFKGRGYIQLTGRSNYKNIGESMGLGDQLVTNPETANEPATAAKILAHFLKRQERQIRAALAADDLAKARKLVNGGSHGLDRFTDAYRIGERLIG